MSDFDRQTPPVNAAPPRPLPPKPETPSPTQWMDAPVDDVGGGGNQPGGTPPFSPSTFVARTVVIVSGTPTTGTQTFYTP